MREVHTHLPAEEFCPACGDQLRTLVSDVLGVRPRELQAGVPTDRSSSAGWKVIRHVRPKPVTRPTERRH
jgi:transposase